MLSTLRQNGPLALLLMASLLEGHQALGATVPPTVEEPKHELHDREPRHNETGLEPRWDWLAADARRRFSVAYHVGFTISMGYTFKSLYQDCKSVKNPNGEVADNSKANCVGAALAAIVGIISAADLSARITGNVREFHIHNPNFRPVQNWRNNFHDGWFGQQRNGKKTLKKRASDMLLPRGHDDLQALSKRIGGAEVRHVGYWTDSESRIVRRDGEPKEVPVLAARINGADMHYAYLGADSDGRHHFKMGLGVPEQATEEALAKRDYDVDPWLHGAFFTKGGINFWGQPDPSSLQGTQVSKEVWVDTDEEFGWLFEQTMCTLQDYWFQDPMRAEVMHFQMYNQMDRATLSAGAMAPFDENGKSAIESEQYQKLVGGLDVHQKCMQKLGFDIQKKQ